MELVEIKDGLFIGSEIDDVQVIVDAQIDCVIDLQGGFDREELAYCVDSYLYCKLWDLLWFSPINEGKINRVAEYGYSCWKAGQRVAVHCTQGKNRSALIIGLILFKSGMEGKDIVALIQSKRDGALYNTKFKNYLENLKR
jgi:hypothetical protein